ncbi:MAG: Sialic acid utilization regulator, RpiR family [Candidatus Carbobacillus altaicus]|uniref:Sialic acid utilization regulator, RpiR family n=1 Tax=Candidatus Carbonibacillus altaicus TaxID=2163959 RepID=A0A2R6Y3V0_9BACL|nr:MAG: Sialic acid utilization regulator, RpiR family [Candidatus Carbobacillus altaicus]
MSQENNVVLKIRSVYRALTKSERKVADTVLEAPDDMVYLSLSDLAAKSGVAETTGVRFCQRIGFYRTGRQVQIHATRNERGRQFGYPHPGDFSGQFAARRRRRRHFLFWEQQGYGRDM